MNHNTDKIVTLIETKIDVLPADVIRLLAYRLPHNSVAYLCRSLKKFNSQICNNDKFQINYGLRHLSSDANNLPAENGHYTVIKELDKLEKMREYEKLNDPYQAVLSKIDYYEYITNNNYDEYIKNKGPTFFDNITLFIAAVAAGNVDIVKYVWNLGVDVNELRDEVISGLWPEIADTKEMEKRLGKYKYIDDPIEVAAEKGYPDVVKYLIEIGFHVTANVFEAAGKSGNLNLVKYLITPDVPEEQIVNILKGAIEAGNINIVEFLDRDIPNNALLVAAKGGNIEMVEYLLNNYDIDINEDNFVNAASESGNLELVKYFVKLGADPHLDEDFALVSAAASGNVDVLKYLVELNLNLEQGRNYATSLSIIPAAKGYLNIIKYLEERGIPFDDVKLLNVAAASGRLNVVAHFLDKGIDPIKIKNMRPNIRTYIDNYNY